MSHTSFEARDHTVREGRDKRWTRALGCDWTQRSGRRMQIALALVLGCVLISAPSGNCQDTVRFSFHRLAFDSAASDNHDHLLIVDNTNQDTSYFLASNGKRVFGVPPGSVENRVRDWIEIPGDNSDRCWSLLSSEVRIENPDEEGDWMTLSEALDPRGGNADWLKLFEALMDRARSSRRSGNIGDRNVLIVFDYEPAFSFTGSGLTDSLRNRLAGIDRTAASMRAQYSFRAIRHGPWPLKVGFILILYSLLLWLRAMIWRRSRSVTLEAPECSQDSATDVSEEGQRESLSRTQPDRADSYPADGEQAESEEKLNWFQRILRRREEKCNRSKQLGELLNLAVRALNEQHRLASAYYLMVRTIAERQHLDSGREEETNPAALRNLDEIRRKVHEISRLPWSTKYEAVRIEPIPPPAGDNVPQVPEPDAAAQGDKTGPTSQSVETRELAEQSSRYDDSRDKVKRDGPRITPRNSSPTAFILGIPNDSVKALLKKLYIPTLNVIWRGRYLRAGREDWLNLAGMSKGYSAMSKSDGVVPASGLMVPRLKRVWTEKPDGVRLDDMSPAALEGAYQSYQNLLAGEKQSTDSTELHKAEVRGYNWFIDSGWPRDVFMGIPFEVFEKIPGDKQKALHDVLWNAQIGADCASLARDLLSANMDDLLHGLDMNPDTRRIIAEAGRYAFDGPGLAQNLDSLLKGLIRSCLEALRSDRLSARRKELGEEVSRRLAEELTKSSISFLTPMLRSRETVELVVKLSQARFSKDEMNIAARALHPLQESARRATETLEGLLRIARLVPTDIKMYEPATSDLGIESVKNQGRSNFLKALWEMFGEAAFKKVYLAKGMHDNDYNHVVDVHHWGATRDSKVIAECQPVVYIFCNNSINLSRIRKAPAAMPPPSAPSSPAAAPSPKVTPPGPSSPAKLSDSESKLPGMVSNEPPSKPPEPPIDEGSASTPSAPEKENQTEDKKPIEPKAKDDEIKPKGDTFRDPSM